MARYTDSILAAARHRYENTNQPLWAIAAELQIGERNLQRMVTQHGWAKRSERVRGLPVTMLLLEQAEGLATPPTPDPSPPLAEPVIGPAREGRTRWLAEEGEQAPSAIERLEALVLKEIEAEEAVRAQLGGKPRMATASERAARTLATLTQTLHALQRLRAGALPERESHDDDDLPRDIDEFRRDLARRIDAFVASRTDTANAGGDSEPPPLDAAG